MRDINKLPRWAQDKIKVLKQDLESYRAKVAQLNGEEDTNIFVSKGTGEPTPLPKDSTIIFKINQDDPMYDQIQIHITEEGVLDISGGGEIKVIPRATNVVKIEYLSRKIRYRVDYKK